MKGEDTNLSMNLFHVQTPSRQWWSYSLIHEGSNTNFHVWRTVIYRNTAGHRCCSIREFKRQLSCNKEEKTAQKCQTCDFNRKAELKEYLQFITKANKKHTFSVMATICVLRGNWECERQSL